VNLEIHSEIVIERVCRCTVEAMIVRTWRTKSCEFGDALGGRDQASLESVFVRG